MYLRIQKQIYNLTVAVSVIVLQLIMRTGPIVQKKEMNVPQCQEKGRQSRLEEPTNEGPYKRRSLASF